MCGDVFQEICPDSPAPQGESPPTLLVGPSWRQCGDLGLEGGRVLVGFGHRGLGVIQRAAFKLILECSAGKKYILHRRSGHMYL